MRGALQTLTRLKGAKAVLALAAVLALSSVPVTGALAKTPASGSGSGTNFSPAAPASATDEDQVAYAIPRNAPSPDMEVILPQPLPPSAVAQYLRIMALQEQGEYSAADRLIGRLDDTTLAGPILANRYLSNGYNSSSAELLNWYGQYGGQPAALAIYQLLLRKLPRGDSRAAGAAAFFVAGNHANPCRRRQAVAGAGQRALAPRVHGGAERLAARQYQGRPALFRPRRANGQYFR